MSIRTFFFGKEAEIPEVQIYLTPPDQIANQTFMLNKQSQDEVETLAEPYCKFAKKNHCYVLDEEGNKSYPAITDMAFNKMKMQKTDLIELYASLNNLSNISIFYERVMDKNEQALFMRVLHNHYTSEVFANLILDKKTVTKRKGFHWTEEREPLGSLKQWYTVERIKSSDSRFIKDTYLEFKEGMYYQLLPVFFEDMMKVPVRNKLSKDEFNGLMFYSGEEAIFALIPVLSSLYDKNRISFCRRNRVASTTLKKAIKTLNMNEFFPNGNKDTSIIAATYLINCYSLYYDSHPKNHNNKPADQDMLKDMLICNNLEKNILIPMLLPQIMGFRKPQLEVCLFDKLANDILGTFVKLHDKGWIDISQFCLHVRTHSEESEENYLILHINDFNKINLVNQYNNNDVNIENFYNEITIPLIKSYIFMMAAMGFVEIAYRGVSADDKEAASCLDGLRYVRLTDLGKYALKITDEYARGTEGKGIAYFELDTENLIIKSLIDKNPYESILDSMSERISKRMYKVTYESFLNDCYNKQDIENRIALFKSYIYYTPPANWQTFFKQILDRCNPMCKMHKKYELFKLPARDKELQRIVMSDPNIRKYTLKAEDYHILVEEEYYKEFRNTLLKYGYLL